MGVQPDFYAVLSIPRGATADEIHHAFRQRARVLHPDVNKSPDATREFQELNNAYQTLSDPARRAAYDRAGLGYAPRARPPYPTDNPGYWSPPRTTYRPPYRTSAPPYDEPFAPRRRATRNGHLPNINIGNLWRWIWMPLLLSRLCTLSSADLSNWWNADFVIAFINNWLPAIVLLVGIAVMVLVVVIAVRWWNR